MSKRLVAEPEIPLRRAAQVRVIYADTDLMGVVYHGTYLRYLEHARVEFIRSLGFAYADLERMGVGLPVIDLAVTYLNPARYDDIVSVDVGLAKLTLARVHFVYRATVQPGDRHEFHGVESAGSGRVVESAGSGRVAEPLELLRAQTFHGCLDMHERRATRMPDAVYDVLARHLEDTQDSQ